MSEMVREVKPFGNSAHVIIPKRLIGTEVVVYTGKFAFVFRKMMASKKA